MKKNKLKSFIYFYNFCYVYIYIYKSNLDYINYTKYKNRFIM